MARLVIANINTPFHDEATNSILIEAGLIHQSGNVEPGRGDIVLELENALAIPGLFNAHDHLAFSMFPRLGSKLYSNYTEWGSDIHSRFKEEINRVLNIPVEDRWLLGVLKNLVSGVTTVIDHDLPARHGANQNIDVLSRFQYIHSLATDARWKFKLNFPNLKPVMMHLGEGVDALATDELRQVAQWNYFNRKIIAVHLISGDPGLMKRLCAMVWCPDSNLFLYGKTAEVNEIKKDIPVLFGTDSPLTASANFWDHLRLARRTGLLSDEELYHAVTRTPAEVFAQKRGTFLGGHAADLVLLKSQSHNPVHSFFEANTKDILLVMKNGGVILFDETIRKQVEPLLKPNDYQPLAVQSSVKFVKGSWAELLQRLSKEKLPLDLSIA
jgi:cytosine/adenosine deaminase-related metal-dependent hydrolase